MNILDRAIMIATEAHAGQVDKGGDPYILHPLRVMLQMPTDEMRAVAVLHDVVEDCDPKYAFRIGLEMPIPVAWAVRTLSRYPLTDYDEYIGEISANPLAREVKIKDLEDNMRWERRHHISEDQFMKYVQAHTRLMLSKHKPSVGEDVVQL